MTQGASWRRIGPWKFQEGRAESFNLRKSPVEGAEARGINHLMSNLQAVLMWCRGGLCPSLVASLFVEFELMTAFKAVELTLSSSGRG